MWMYDNIHFTCIGWLRTHDNINQMVRKIHTNGITCPIWYIVIIYQVIALIVSITKYIRITTFLELCESIQIWFNRGNANSQLIKQSEQIYIYFYICINSTWIRKKESDNSSSKVNDGDDVVESSSPGYNEAFKAGSSVAKTLTSTWNSQENPGKVYVANRRLHHGAIGSAMKLSKHFEKSEPTATGVLSGIGEGLAKDDYADRKEWFKFKKKEESGTGPQTLTSSDTF